MRRAGAALGSLECQAREAKVLMCSQGGNLDQGCAQDQGSQTPSEWPSEWGSGPDGGGLAGGQAPDQLTAARFLPKEPPLPLSGPHMLSGCVPFILMAVNKTLLHKGPVCGKQGPARFSASHPIYPTGELHPHLEVGSWTIIKRM